MLTGATVLRFRRIASSLNGRQLIAVTLLKADFPERPETQSIQSTFNRRRERRVSGIAHLPLNGLKRARCCYYSPPSAIALRIKSPNSGTVKAMMLCSGL